MRIVSIFLATLVLIFSLSACQIVNEEELATIREEGYQQGERKRGKGFCLGTFRTI